MEQRYDKETGLPVDRAYLECGLPPYLQRSLDTMKRAWEAEDNGANDLHFDAYYCELQADINSAEVEGEISSEQASAIDSIRFPFKTSLSIITSEIPISRAFKTSFLFSLSVCSFSDKSSSAIFFKAAFFWAVSAFDTTDFAK